MSRSPEERREYLLTSTYGITSEDYERMLIKQHGVCAICNRTQSHKRKGKTLPLFVDHCHKTGKVRGLLCGVCNKTLGCFQDDTVLLMQAIKYLEENNGR